MKKLLLGLSVLCMMGSGFHAMADQKTNAGKRILQQGQRGKKAGKNTTGIVGEGAPATMIDDGIRAVESAPAVEDSADMMFSKNSAGVERVENGAQCSLKEVGGVNTELAHDKDLVKPSVCMTTISHTSKAKWAKAINRIAAYLQGANISKFSASLSRIHLEGAQQAWWTGLANAIGISFAKAKKNAAEMCRIDACPELNPFCGTQVAQATN